MSDATREATQRMWWYLLFAAALFLAAETVLGNRLVAEKPCVLRSAESGRQRGGVMRNPVRTQRATGRLGSI